MLTRLKLAWGRRYYYLHKLLPVEVPAHILSWTPDGYRVQRLGNTGVRLVEHFCSADEAAGLVGRAGDAGVLIVSAPDAFDAGLQPLLHRAAMLFGIPHTHVEKLVVARWGGDTEARVLHEHVPHSEGARHHNLLLFLSGVPDKSPLELRFPALRLAVQPRVGRAVCWSRDAGAADVFGLAGSLAEPADADVWVLQLWLNQRVMLPQSLHLAAPPPQARKGEALKGNEVMPEGVWSPANLDLQDVFGKPDKLKGML